ncbi:DUF1132 family protein [Neisseria meningitidis]|uniref:DUF1132 family protein n=7 Tax=Neisseria meningitidis TaxID=487 RepID=UPI0012429C1B|nr:DUF1132 family protein [Neisseria meningitidis]
MNKPFITQAQLALYKYQPSSKYFGQSMAVIAQSEFVEFAKINKSENVIDCFSFFWNRRIKHDIWLISFSDNSEKVIKESLKDGHKIYKFEFARINAKITASISRAGVLAGGGKLARLGAKFSTRAVPYVGTALLAHDVYETFKEDIQARGYQYDPETDKFAKVSG